MFTPETLRLALTGITVGLTFAMITAAVIFHLMSTARCCWFGRHDWNADPYMERITANSANRIMWAKCSKCGKGAKKPRKESE